MKSTILTIIVTAFFALTTFAQKPTEFAEKTAVIKKIDPWLDFPAEGRNSKSGGGYSANVDLLNPKPKKVALVSFYLYDPASSKTSKSSYSVSAECWATTPEKGQEQVDAFYAKSIEVLKSEFKSYGMDLLTPQEFLDTDERAEFYYGFNQESAKKEKTERSQMAVKANLDTYEKAVVVEASASTLKASPKGYRAFFVANENLSKSAATNFMNAGIMGAIRKMSSSIGYELCKGLGVDAVVVCYIVSRKTDRKKEIYAINAVNLYMFGPNPKMESEEDKNRGQFYCGQRFFCSGLPEYENEKDGTKGYDHIENVMKVLAGKLCNYVINKEK